MIDMDAFNNGMARLMTARKRLKKARDKATRRREGRLGRLMEMQKNRKMLKRKAVLK